MADSCTHLDTIDEHATPSADGCEDCLRAGGSWVHLRMCRQCGHVGCCDSSPARHATAHHGATRHPVVQSFEPGEDWLYCYADDVAFEIPALEPSPAHS
ncbi:MAG: UBP-type zinc finger domain-containing protein [Phycicoccus sp.]